MALKRERERKEKKEKTGDGSLKSHSSSLLKFFFEKLQLTFFKKIASDFAIVSIVSELISNFLCLFEESNLIDVSSIHRIIIFVQFSPFLPVNLLEI